MLPGPRSACALQIATAASTSASVRMRAHRCRNRGIHTDSSHRGSEPIGRPQIVPTAASHVAACFAVTSAAALLPNAADLDALYVPPTSEQSGSRNSANDAPACAIMTRSSCDARRTVPAACGDDCDCSHASVTASSVGDREHPCASPSTRYSLSMSANVTHVRVTCLPSAYSSRHASTRAAAASASLGNACSTTSFTAAYTASRRNVWNDLLRSATTTVPPPSSVSCGSILYANVYGSLESPYCPRSRQYRSVSGRARLICTADATRRTNCGAARKRTWLSPFGIGHPSVARSAASTVLARCQSSGALDHNAANCAPTLASDANTCVTIAPVQPVLPPLDVRCFAAHRLRSVAENPTRRDGSVSRSDCHFAASSSNATTSGKYTSTSSVVYSSFPTRGPRSITDASFFKQPSSSVASSDAAHARTLSCGGASDAANLPPSSKSASC